MRRATRTSTRRSSSPSSSSAALSACMVGRMAVWPATFASFTVSSSRGRSGFASGSMKPVTRRSPSVRPRSVSRSSCVMYCESVRGYVASFFSYRDCKAVRVRAAVRPCSRLMSFCNPVRSYRRGGASCCCLRSALKISKVKSSELTIRSRVSASSRLSKRSPDSFHPPIGATTFQYGRATWPAICRSRSTIIASVGVCTRPTVNLAL